MLLLLLLSLDVLVPTFTDPLNFEQVVYPYIFKCQWYLHNTFDFVNKLSSIFIQEEELVK